MLLGNFSKTFQLSCNYSEWLPTQTCIFTLFFSCLKKKKNPLFPDAKLETLQKYNLIFQFLNFLDISAFTLWQISCPICAIIIGKLQRWSVAKLIYISALIHWRFGRSGILLKLYFCILRTIHFCSTTFEI